jgi:S-adenosylmethionine hydrolase
VVGPIITLLTDFGVTDTYVGEVKGAILAINPQVVLVDLTHHVKPQAVHEAAFLLGNAHRSFPSGAVHLAVVDPGVGTGRRPLLLATDNALYVGPDNGIFSYILGEHLLSNDVSKSRSDSATNLVAVPSGVMAYELTKSQYWRHPVSRTFHARDIFGPVAAYLSLGTSPEHLGEQLENINSLSLLGLEWKMGALTGYVLHVDPFGNLITNIPECEIGCGSVQVIVGGRTICGLSEFYAQDKLFVALVGSHGMLEIAVPNGNAALALQVGVGEEVVVRHTEGIDELSEGMAPLSSER